MNQVESVLVHDMLEPDIHIFEDMLDNFNMFRKYCDSVNFDGEVNPVDGVEYPGISIAIPQSIQDSITVKLMKLFGKYVDINSMFMRLSVQGVNAPHYAHTDTVMGQYSLMLYLNREEHCLGGTSFVTHRETGMASDPESQEQLEAWQKDTNTPECWDTYHIVEMKPNRGLVFDATNMHAAEPFGGFGSDATNGRLVLTAFFDVG